MVLQEIAPCTGSRRPGRDPARRYIWSRSARRCRRRIPSAAAMRGWQRHCRRSAARRRCAQCRRLPSNPRHRALDWPASPGTGIALPASRRLPLGEVFAVDQGVGDAEPRQDLLDHIAAGAEHRPWRRRRDRRSAAPRGMSPLRPPCRSPCRGAGRAFQRRHAALEHRHGRIAVARIGKSLGALESRFGFLREFHRHSPTSETALRTSPGIRSEAGRRAPLGSAARHVAGLFVRRHVHGSPLSRAEGPVPKPLPRLAGQGSSRIRSREHSGIPMISMQAISHHTALVYVMVVVSAADGSMSEKEIAHHRRPRPGPCRYSAASTSRLVRISQECGHPRRTRRARRGAGADRLRPRPIICARPPTGSRSKSRLPIRA